MTKNGVSPITVFCNIMMQHSKQLASLEHLQMVLHEAFHIKSDKVHSSAAAIAAVTAVAAAAAGAIAERMDPPWI